MNSNAPKPSPLLKAAGLWARSSAKGGRYLSGRWGGLKVLILENRDRKGDDEPSHHLYFVEAPPRPERREGAQERGDEPRGAPMPPDRQRPSQPQRSDVQGHVGGGGDGPAPLRPEGSSRAPAGDRFEEGPPWER